MDIAYLLVLQDIREALGGVFDAYMLRVTSAAESLPAFLLLAGVYWCVDKRAGQCMGWNTALACTWNQFLKAQMRVERPWVRDGRIRPVAGALAAASGYSFPSGHTARAVASWGTAGCCAFKKGKEGGDRDKKLLGVLLWVLTALILFSRNYLGVHTPQDVLVSLLIGLVLVLATGKLLDWVEAHPYGDVAACVAGCLLCFLPMLRVGCLTNAGAGMGLLLGWLAERRFVRFDTGGPAGRRFARFLAGSVLAVLLLETLRAALGLVMAGKYAGFFAMFVFCFFVMAGYPWLFSRFGAQGHGTVGIRMKRGAGAGILCVFLCLLLVFSAASVRQGQIGQSAAVDENAAAGAGRVQVIAHRGWSSVFPENTMAAFRGAMELGADYIETDVQMSKDGQVVVFHDGSLERVTGCVGAVCDYTYEELCAMDAGGWFAGAFSGERIPTLRQMLGLLRDSDMKVYLEMKDIGDVEGFAEAVYAVAKEAGMADRCVFASFRYEYLVQMKALDPGCQVLYNTESGEAGLVEGYPADYYGVSAGAVNAGMASAVHGRGGKLFVWTVDDPLQMEGFAAMGADGIVTNRPELAKAILNGI